MEDSVSVQDVPNTVLNMVRMFLAASTRGDHAVLILESRNKQMITKYRSVEKVAGAPATANTQNLNTNRRRVNPARARRSKLRLEKFQRKKEDEKQQMQQETGNKACTGDSRSSSSLVVQLSKEVKSNVEIGPHSPILQVDGQDEALAEEVSYTFKSEYGEEDICSSLAKLFPPFVAQLDSRVRLGRMAADHQCIVSLKLPFGQKGTVSWPQMPKDDDVFRGLKKLQ